MVAIDAQALDSRPARRDSKSGLRPGPQTQSPKGLLALARTRAEQVEPLAPGAALGQRQYTLLERSLEHEIWLIFWPEGTGLVLHDHGGSCGAFYVAGGTLEETSTSAVMVTALPVRAGTLTTGARLRRRRVWTGEGRSFGPGYVHSLINPQPVPATSVHVYSPPLTSMTFYSWAHGGIAAARTVTQWEGAPPD